MGVRIEESKSSGPNASYTGNNTQMIATKAKSVKGILLVTFSDRLLLRAFANQQLLSEYQKGNSVILNSATISIGPCRPGFTVGIVHDFPDDIRE